METARRGDRDRLRHGGLQQPPVAVVEQGTGQCREAHGQYRQHEQFVPEDVTAVGLAVQSARRYSGVEIGGVRR